MTIDDKDLDRLSSILGATGASFSSLGRGATSLQLQQERQIKQLMKEFNLKDAAAKQLLKTIQQEEKELKDSEARAKKEDELFQNRAKAIEKFGSELKQFAGSAMSASQSMYNSDQAFAAVKPTLELMSGAVKSITSALSGMFAGIPVLGSVFGGIDKIIGVTIDLGTQALSQQIDNAQKYVDTFSQVSKAGAAFGGNIEQMRRAAANGGVSIDSLSKFIIGNIESLSAMGGTIDMAANKITAMGKGISANNPKILAMYGSLEAVNGGIADYYAMMAKTGMDVNRTNADLTSGAKAYLINMKELSALTGKSADALKKEQEARLTSAAYAIAVSKMGLTQQQNTEEALQLTKKNYGDAAEKYAQEFIATNGKVTSEQSLMFRSMYPEIAKTVQMTLSATDQGVDSFKRSTAEIIESRKAINKEEAVNSKESLLRLQAGGVDDAVLELFNKVAVAVIASQSSQGAAKDAAKILKEQRDADASASTKTYAEAIRSLNDFKIKMDAITEKTLPKVGDMVNALYRIQEKITEIFLDDNTSITWVMSNAIRLIDNLIKDSRMNNPPGGKNSPVPPGPDNKGSARNLNEQRRKAWENKDTMVKDLSALNFSSNEIKTKAEEAGISKNLYDTLLSMKGQAVTSLIREGGAHASGKAADVRLKDLSDEQMLALLQQVTPGTNPAVKFSQIETSGDEEMAIRLRKAFEAMGGDPRRIVTAGDGLHLHVEAFAKGGITSGPSLAGEAGPEAVIPLPDGRSIPVNLDMSEMVNKLEEMITLLRDQRDNSEKMLYAVQ